MRGCGFRNEGRGARKKDGVHGALVHLGRDRVDRPERLVVTCVLHHDLSRRMATEAKREGERDDARGRHGGAEVN